MTQMQTQPNLQSAPAHPGGWKIALIGCGQIGSFAGNLLARQPAVREMLFIDYQTYGQENLPTQNISHTEIGQPKAVAAAQRALLTRPCAASGAGAFTANASVDRVENIPWGMLRDCDLICACVDSRHARVRINTIASRLGKLWLDAGVQGEGLLARVNIYSPSPHTPCLECPFANDFTGKRATVPTTGGGSVAAIDIQRHYLTLAQMNVHANWMPAWAPTAIEYWDSILRRIEEGGSDAVATCLDWAIKRQVFGAHLRKRGFTWEKLEQWTHLAGLLGNGLSSLRPPMPASILSTAFVKNRHGPLAAMIEQLDPYLGTCALEWNELDTYFKIRQELFEIDTRFGELGGGGIFDRLDAAGALDHRISGVDNIEHAMTKPPRRRPGASLRHAHSTTRPPPP
jgi:hypothetical protein